MEHSRITTLRPTPRKINFAPPAPEKKQVPPKVVKEWAERWHDEAKDYRAEAEKLRAAGQGYGVKLVVASVLDRCAHCLEASLERDRNAKEV